MTETISTEALSRTERARLGKAARTDAPLASHADADLNGNRDPVALLMDQAKTRVPELVPIRHARMSVSPFAYFRGAALPMAADLARTPTSGLRVQACGDAHMSNFGGFASPERRLVFDVNDFDETLPGPFEWDVKRLAASLVIAARDNRFPGKVRRRIANASVEAYRTAMRDFAEQPKMDVWYAHLDVNEAVATYRSQLRPKRYKALTAGLARAPSRDSMQALGKLTTIEDGQRKIISDPPTVVPVEELFSEFDSEAIYDQLRAVLDKYRRTLQTDRRHLLDQFRMVQVARKVVGVGSVGTRAWIILMETSDGEPMFLQAKEAQKSVLAEYCGASRYRNQGERVVAGQHLMQALSDIFLGWTRVLGPDGVERDYYVRQLRDWKVSAPIERMRPEGMEIYARLCGWTLARAHARSGDPVTIAAYLGASDKFDAAVTAFAETYADQNERDYIVFQAAVKSDVENVAA